MAVADARPDGQTGLSLLGASEVNRTLRAQVRNAATGEAIRNLEFGPWEWYWKVASVDQIVLPNPETKRNPAVAQISLVDTVSDPVPATVEIRDALTDEFITWFNTVSGLEVLDIIPMPDLNGNGSPELAELQQQESDGAVSVLIKDFITRADLRRIYF